MSKDFVYLKVSKDLLRFNTDDISVVKGKELELINDSLVNLDDYISLTSVVNSFKKIFSQGRRLTSTIGMDIKKTIKNDIIKYKIPIYHKRLILYIHREYVFRLFDSVNYLLELCFEDYEVNGLSEEQASDMLAKISNELHAYTLKELRGLEPKPWGDEYNGSDRLYSEKYNKGLSDDN